jgi:hypothetical protein
MLNTTFLAVKQIAKDAEFILGKVAAVRVGGNQSLTTEEIERAAKMP